MSPRSSRSCSTLLRATACVGCQSGTIASSSAACGLAPFPFEGSGASTRLVLLRPNMGSLLLHLQLELRPVLADDDGTGFDRLDREVADLLAFEVAAVV